MLRVKKEFIYRPDKVVNDYKKVMIDAFSLGYILFECGGSIYSVKSNKKKSELGMRREEVEII